MAGGTGNKYMTLIAGKESMVGANQTSAGSGDAGKIPALDASGKLDVTMLPVGVGPVVKLIISSDALAAGDFINVYLNAGVANVRLADSSIGREANGWVLASCLVSGTATVYFSGTNNALTGMTIGARQYLGANGQVTETPATTGIHQYLGDASSATDLPVEFQDYIVL